MSTLIKLLLKFLALLPLRTIHALGTAVGYCLVLVPNRRRQTTLVNIDLCLPELGEKQRQQLAHCSLIQLARGVFESSALWLWDTERALALVKKTYGEETLKQAYARKKGVILALPHLGMWEIIGLYCSARYPMTSLYRPPPISGLEQLMRSGRQRLGAKLVPTNRSGVRALYSALEKGELVAILPDQNPAAGSGVFAPFFGIQAYTMTLLSRLAANTQAAVIFVYAERLSRGQGFALHFEAGSHEINSADSRISVTGVNTGVEKCVRQLPQQYLWSYKRFQTRPPGEPPIYVK